MQAFEIAMILLLQPGECPLNLEGAEDQSRRVWQMLTQMIVFDQTTHQRGKTHAVI